MPVQTRHSRYFAGIKLGRKYGISSDNVFLGKKFFEKIIDSIGIVFLPTIAYESYSCKECIRLSIISYFDNRNYIVVTRPLSFSLKDILPVINFLKKEKELPTIASIVSEKLSGYKKFIDALSGKVDGFEIDLGLFYALYGFKRGFESYAIDIIEELISYSNVPIIAKLSPNIPLNIDFLGSLESLGIGGLVFSPHPIYSVGHQLFRIHSPQISAIYSYIWAEIVVSKIGTNTAYVSDVPPLLQEPTDIMKVFDLILYDVQKVLEFIPDENIKVENRGFPLKWVKIPENLRPAIKNQKNICASVCPYDAFKKNVAQNKGIAIANSMCDKCGLCITLCGKNVTLASEILPE